jgi:hypothetical protein
LLELYHDLLRPVYGQLVLRNIDKHRLSGISTAHSSPFAFTLQSIPSNVCGENSADVEILEVGNKGLMVHPEDTITHTEFVLCTGIVFKLILGLVCPFV